MFQILLSLLTLSLITACSEPNLNELPLNKVVLTVKVEPEMADCVGVGPMKCLVVDGEYFYENIEGFNFEAGNAYIIEIERSQAYTDKKVPADVGAYRYKLIKILKKQSHVM